MHCSQTWSDTWSFCRVLKWPFPKFLSHTGFYGGCYQVCTTAAGIVRVKCCYSAIYIIIYLLKIYHLSLHYFFIMYNWIILSFFTLNHPHPHPEKKWRGRNDISVAINVYFIIITFQSFKNFLHETLVIKHIRNVYKWLKKIENILYWKHLQSYFISKALLGTS